MLKKNKFEGTLIINKDNILQSPQEAAHRKYSPAILNK